MLRGFLALIAGCSVSNRCAVIIKINVTTIVVDVFNVKASGGVGSKNWETTGGFYFKETGGANWKSYRQILALANSGEGYGA